MIFSSPSGVGARMVPRPSFLAPRKISKEEFKSMCKNIGGAINAFLSFRNAL